MRADHQAVPLAHGIGHGDGRMGQASFSQQHPAAALQCARTTPIHLHGWRRWPAPRGAESLPGLSMASGTPRFGRFPNQGQLG